MYDQVITDECMQEIARQYFELLYFKPIPIERGAGLHFQSITLRRS